MALVDFELKDVGGIFTSLREAITGETIEDKGKILGLLSSLETTFVKVKGAIITAEAKSEHWIVASWRPLTMLVFTFIIANNYILVPYFQAFGWIVVPLTLDQNMWDLLKLGLGGYVVGRSVEKAMKHYAGKGN